MCSYQLNNMFKNQSHLVLNLKMKKNRLATCWNMMVYEYWLSSIEHIICTVRYSSSRNYEIKEVLLLGRKIVCLILIENILVMKLFVRQNLVL